MDFHGYMRKEYEVKFLKFFSLEITSEDREDGTYKHFINIYLFNKNLVSVTYKTGISMNDYHIYEKNFYAGYITKGDNNYNFEIGKKGYKFNNNMNENEFSSTFKDASMKIVIDDNNKQLIKNITEYYNMKK